VKEDAALLAIKRARKSTGIARTPIAIATCIKLWRSRVHRLPTQQQQNVTTPVVALTIAILGLTCNIFPICLNFPRK